MSLARYTVEFKGVVQGVGFRPAIYRLAVRKGITGWIQNRSGKVVTVLDGKESTIKDFIRSLPRSLPSNARIDSTRILDNIRISKDAMHPKFNIVASGSQDSPDAILPPDLTVCDDCRKDIMERSDRRFHYPFTTCTNCGPRYTVVESMPYDRKQTTMSVFKLCPDCRKEYNDPEDRRFHAETIACPKCGPVLTIDGRLYKDHFAALKIIRRSIADGKIVAVKGIGGFLLAVDAFNKRAISTLRARKNRPHKPFAVMARDIETAKKYCIISKEAEKLLTSQRSPIVIVDIKEDVIRSGRLPVDLISPDSTTCGIMLPTSPLHELLFIKGADNDGTAFDLLIMTSGNKRSEPICLTNQEAGDRLGGIADTFVFHDREIKLRNDDSLCIIQNGAPQIWRRARGYAPSPIRLPFDLKKTVLGMGAEIKNTVALGFENKVIVSPHIGDLETPEAIEGMKTMVKCLPEFLEKEPEVIAVDLNPDMHCSILGRELAKKYRAPVVEIQHHHAHAAACLAENGYTEGLALVFDGTGLGTDGKIWGAEALEIKGNTFRRLATFAPAPLPGGDAAVRQPVRQLVARWIQSGISIKRGWLKQLDISEAELKVWASQIKSGANTPYSHSAGRLFDSFAVLAGIAPANTTYEGQPAIRLEALARRSRSGRIQELKFKETISDGMLTIDWAPVFARLSEKPIRSNRENFALSVHHAVANAVGKMIDFARSSTRTRNVCLSGGCFMNRTLNELLIPGLKKKGVNVLVHRELPPNDGCISFGQIVAARR